MEPDDPVKIRVGHVDDHEITSRGLQSVIADEPDLQWVGAAASVAALLDQWVDLDVVVLDLWLGDDSTPAQNVERLTARNVPTLIYTSAEHPDLLRAAARASVLGSVRKDAPPALIIEAIRTVARGEQFVTAEWAAAIDADSDLPMANLSPQERQVLTMIASGKTALGVAKRLGIEESTIKDYLRRIRLKYAEAGRPAPGRADLTARAIEDGHQPVRRRLWNRG